MQSVTELLPGSLPRRQVEAPPKNKVLDEATRTLVGSVFYGTLMKTMRESEMKGKYGHGGRGEEAFGAQLDAMLAERAGKGTNGGLAAALYESLERQQGLMDGARATVAAEGA